MDNSHNGERKNYRLQNAVIYINFKNKKNNTVHCSGIDYTYVVKSICKW